jgi:tetratricopeptide (TPR) repeat protein
MSGEYSTRAVAKLLKMPERRVREFVKAGVVGRRLGDSGSEQRFDFRDVVVLRMAGRLLDNGLSPGKVRQALTLLKRQVQHDKPITGLQLFAEGGKVLASDGEVLWEPVSGQAHLNFAPKKMAAEPTPGPRSAAALSASERDLGADSWFDIAMSLEDSEPHRAYDAYLRALEADPEHVEANINIGRLCSAAGELKRAAAYFRQAIRLDPVHPVAHFNLAVTLHDLGEVPAALDEYRAAIRADPDFADAHYNLSMLLEQRGDHEGAQKHRAAYEAASRQSGQ